MELLHMPLPHDWYCTGDLHCLRDKALLELPRYRESLKHLEAYISTASVADRARTLVTIDLFNQYMALVCILLP